MNTPTQLATGPPTFGKHVGHRDRDAWLDHAPGRVVAVDTTCDPPRVRVHPTRDRHPEWEAHATDLVRLGRSCACGYGYLLGDDVTSGEPVDVIAQNGVVHRIVVPPAMVVDVYESSPTRHRCRVRTADGTLWDVAGRDLVYVTPRQ
jgi:hypothetical protein